MRFLLGCLRIAAAAAAFAGIYWLFDPKYSVGRFATPFFGLTVAVIILIVKSKDISQIVRATLVCLVCTIAAGFSFAFLFAPTMGPAGHRSVVGAHFVIGITVGMIAAIWIIACREPD